MSLVIGTATVVLGPVYVLQSDGQVRLLEQGDSIHEGDVVQSAPGGGVQLVLADGSVISLGPNEVAMPGAQGGATPEGATPEGEDGGSPQQVLLFYEGRPVVAEAESGGQFQVLTTTGLAVLAEGEDSRDYYLATPEEIDFFQGVVLSTLGGGAPDRGVEDPGLGWQEGSLTGLSFSVFDLTLPSPFGAFDGASDGSFLNAALGELLGAERQDDRENESLIEDTTSGTQQVDDTVLNLREATEAMQVDLAAGEYHPLATPADTRIIAETVVNVIGARNFNNVITGDARANEITSGEHTDTLDGGAGDDVFLMGTNLDATDTIDGGVGDDTLRFTQSGANPTDALNGVANVERVILGDADTTLVVTDNLLAPGQSLLLDASGIVSGGNLDFDGSAEGQGSFTIFGSAAGDRIIGGVGNDSLNGGGGADSLNGGAGNDTLSGGAGTDTIDGGGGNDTIDGGAGADTLNGGAGNNTLSYASSASGVDVSLNAGTASGGDAQGDTVTWASFQNLLGSAAADTLEGRNGEANLIQGQGGDDTLQYTTGGDTLEGGAGNDTFLFGADPAAGTTIDGGAGTDTLQATASVDYRSATITGVERLFIGDGQYAQISGSQAGNGWTVVGTTGAQELRFGMDGTSLDISALSFESWTEGEDTVTITGTSSDETITGSAAGDTINGGGGADVIHAGAGADTIVLSTSPGSGTVIDGGAGTDTLAISTSGIVSLVDARITGIEHMNLSGGALLGLTVIQADGQSWDISGASGDTLYILGSSGSDTSDLSGLDLDDFSGALTVFFEGGNDAIAMGTNLSSAVTVKGGSGTDTLYFTSGATDDLDGVSYVETIILGDVTTSLTLGGDSLVATGKTVTIDASGLTHAFTFDGSAETDGSLDIRGGSGNDDITGGAGNDTIEGGAGADALNGGAGNNTLSYAPSSSGVNVSLDAGTASGGDAQGDAITGSSFQNLTGSEAGDILEGRSGVASELRGLGGNDTLKYTTGATVIDGGSGTDTLQANASVDYSSVTLTGVERVLIGSGQYARFGSSQVAAISTVVGAAGAQELRVGMNGTSLDLSSLVFESWTDGEDAVTITGTVSNETIIGSAFGDTIKSGGGADVIHAGAGNDTIHLTSQPGSGTVIDGGAGDDVLSITSSNVDLRSASITGIEHMNLSGSAQLLLAAAQAHEQSWNISGASGDILYIFGTTSDDTSVLSGLDLDDFSGALHVSLDSGGDTITMGTNLSSAVTVDGGSGTDTLSFTSGATTDLDHVTNVETIILGDAATSLTLGNDDLVAAGRTVTIDASGLTHTFTFDGSNETDGNLVLLGGEGDDTIIGGNGADIINGGDGADFLDGGSGTAVDIVSYAGSDEGVHADLDFAAGTHGGWAEGDTLRGFEGVIGSDYADEITASNYTSGVFYGMDGDDHFTGRGGDDTLVGGAGNDTFVLNGVGDEVIRYESYAEVVTYTDTITGFYHGQDTLEFKNSEFRFGGSLSGNEFYDSFAALAASNYNGPCFVYDSSTLYYDADGDTNDDGGADAVAVAVFSDGANLTYQDIDLF